MSIFSVGFTLCFKLLSLASKTSGPPQCPSNCSDCSSFFFVFFPPVDFSRSMYSFKLVFPRWSHYFVSFHSIIYPELPYLSPTFWTSQICISIPNLCLSSKTLYETVYKYIVWLSLTYPKLIPCMTVTHWPSIPLPICQPPPLPILPLWMKTYKWRDNLRFFFFNIHIQLVNSFIYSTSKKKRFFFLDSVSISQLHSLSSCFKNISLSLLK